MEISYMIELALTAGIGVITFFLKRTIDELDSCKRNIAKIKEDLVLKDCILLQADGSLYH